MNTRELSFKLTQQWQKWPDADVFISQGDELVSLADVDYDEENSRFVMIPEGNNAKQT